MLGALPHFVRAVALGAFLLGWMWTKTASAATVAVLSAGTSPALAEVAFRLRGELAALRFEVLLLRRPAAADPRAWLEQMAEERGLDAALEVVGEPTMEAVDVWIFQRSPRRAQVARVVAEPDSPDRAGTLAIRAIEVLRSYDVEAELTDQSRPPLPPAPIITPKSDARPTEEAQPRPRHAERFGVELGAGLLTGLDGVGPALSPVLRVDGRATARWLVLATVSGLGTRPTLQAPAGKVRVAQSYATLGLCYCPTLGPAVAPYFALSAGATRIALEGTAVAPARGHAVAHWAVLVDAGAGARFLLPGAFYATLSGHVQVAQPRVTIHVVDEQLGSTGRPSLLANLMVGTWL